MKRPRLSRKRLLAILKKEVLHIMHDPRTVAIVILMPLVQLIMFGYALNLEIQDVRLAVFDYAQTPQSRHLIERFKGSKFFRPYFPDRSPEEIETIFKNREARAVLVIPADFSRSLSRNLTTPVQVLIDAADANAATMIRNYCSRVLTEASAVEPFFPFEVRSTIFFNPDLKSSRFFVPGLIAMILIMISALLTSVTIVREKETGTLEQILVSPVRPREIIIGKVLPYIVLAFLDGALILLVAIFVFRVPFQGSLLLLILLTVVYITTALSMGLLISTVTRSQQVAMMMAQIATLLPTMMLSGLIFPIASMPRLLQYITYLVPARYFLLIVRGILLKGSHFVHLWQPALVLLIMAVVMLNVAVKKFRFNLES